MVYAPGLIRWAISGAQFPEDRPQMIRIISEGWNIPADAAEALLTGKVPFEVEDEAVVFTA
jgi:hypothetical protein